MLCPIFILTFITNWHDIIDIQYSAIGPKESAFRTTVIYLNSPYLIGYPHTFDRELTSFICTRMCIGLDVVEGVVVVVPAVEAAEADLPGDKKRPPCTWHYVFFVVSTFAQTFSVALLVADTIVLIRYLPFFTSNSNMQFILNVIKNISYCW